MGVVSAPIEDLDWPKFEEAWAQIELNEAINKAQALAIDRGRKVVDALGLALKDMISIKELNPDLSISQRIEIDPNVILTIEPKKDSPVPFYVDLEAVTDKKPGETVEDIVRLRAEPAPAGYTDAPFTPTMVTAELDPNAPDPRLRMRGAGVSEFEEGPVAVVFCFEPISGVRISARLADQQLDQEYERYRYPGRFITKLSTNRDDQVDPNHLLVKHAIRLEGVN